MEITVREIGKRSLGELGECIPLNLRKEWMKNTFNRKKFLAFQAENCVAGLIAVEGVEPYTGLVQISFKHCFSSGECEFGSLLANFLSAAKKVYQNRHGWFSVITKSREQASWAVDNGFQSVQIDLVKSLGNFRERDACFRVREAVDRDLGWIRTLASTCLPFVVCKPPGYDPQLTFLHCQENRPTITQDLDLRDKRIRVLVAHNGRGQRCAYAVMDFGANEAWIHDFAVEPHFRGGAVARDLLDACEKAACELGHQELWATASMENRRSWLSAKRVGFEEVSRRWLKPIKSSR